MLLELGNAHPQDVFTDVDPESGQATERRVDLGGPRVTYVTIPDGTRGRSVGIDRLPGETDEAFEARDAAHVAENELGPMLVFPEQHDDSLLPDDMALALAGTAEGPGKSALRRLLIRAHLNERAAEGITHLPNHEVFVAITHPKYGAWQRVSAPDTQPTWVHCPDHPGLEAFLAEFFECPRGRPDDVEDTHWTQHGEVYPPGAIPPPDAGITMLHTSWGRDAQALDQFFFVQNSLLGVNGTATASSSTSLTGGTETGSFSHTANDAAGCMLVILTPSGDAGKWGFVKSNTSGASPVYTVDRWYAVSTPGGAAAATPSSTATYTIVPGGAPAWAVALTTDTTTPSLGGAAGTADAPAATTALTSEITTAGGGLIRKIYTTLTHTAGAATVVSTTTFTANGSDTLPVTVAKAALCASVVAGGTGLHYMTLVSPTATLSASGDQLTLTWTFTET